MVANVPETRKCVQQFLKPPRADYGFTEYLLKNGLPEGKPLIDLVAGEGFEPSTFGL
jgi:hypothetical protein